MNNINTEVDDLQDFNASGSSLLRGGGGSRGSFFIPGITAKARCLSSSDSFLHMDDHSFSRSRNSLNYDEGNSTSGRRNMLLPQERSSRGNLSRKDARFSKMMVELTASRKEADDARVSALLVKERFENEASSLSIQDLLDNDPIFNELVRFCYRAA